MKLMQEISEINVKYKVLLDFNFLHIRWGNNTTGAGVTDFSSAFIEKMCDCYLTQHIQNITRIRVDNTGNLLDLLLRNEESIVEDIKVESSLGKSDHVNIIVTVDTQELQDRSKTGLCL